MEAIKIKLSDIDFDEAVHGKPEGQPTLPDAGDLAIYIKKKATVSGAAGAVLTFTVQLPNGNLQRVQTVTTVTNLMMALSVLKGWQDGGHLK